MLTKEQILEWFCYDSGVLRWKKSPSIKIKPGEQAGKLTVKGYRVVTLFRKNHSVHKIVFVLHHGYCPVEVDHIDRNRDNNLVDNLRECTTSQNAMNRKTRPNKDSGHRNISKRIKRTKGGYYEYWEVNVWKEGKRHYIGNLKNLEDAKRAAIAAREELHKQYALHY